MSNKDILNSKLSNNYNNNISLDQFISNNITHSASDNNYDLIDSINKSIKNINLIKSDTSIYKDTEELDINLSIDKNNDCLLNNQINLITEKDINSKPNIMLVNNLNSKIKPFTKKIYNYKTSSIKNNINKNNNFAINKLNKNNELIYEYSSESYPNNSNNCNINNKDSKLNTNKYYNIDSFSINKKSNITNEFSLYSRNKICNKSAYYKLNNENKSFTRNNPKYVQTINTLKKDNDCIIRKFNSVSGVIKNKKYISNYQSYYNEYNISNKLNKDIENSKKKHFYINNFKLKKNQISNRLNSIEICKNSVNNNNYSMINKEYNKSKNNICMNKNNLLSYSNLNQNNLELENKRNYVFENNIDNSNKYTNNSSNKIDLNYNSNNSIFRNNIHLDNKNINRINNKVKIRSCEDKIDNFNKEKSYNTSKDSNKNKVKVINNIISELNKLKNLLIEEKSFSTVDSSYILENISNSFVDFSKNVIFDSNLKLHNYSKYTLYNNI